MAVRTVSHVCEGELRRHLRRARQQRTEVRLVRWKLDLITSDAPQSDWRKLQRRRRQQLTILLPATRAANRAPEWVKRAEGEPRPLRAPLASRRRAR